MSRGKAGLVKISLGSRYKCQLEEKNAQVQHTYQFSGFLSVNVKLNYRRG